jgi:hypothetical protein
MRSDQENKVDEDSIRGLSDGFFLGFWHHHDFLSDPCVRKMPHLASLVYISVLLVPTLEEYLRWSSLGCISDLLGGVLRSAASYWFRMNDRIWLRLRVARHPNPSIQKRKNEIHRSLLKFWGQNERSLFFLESDKCLSLSDPSSADNETLSITFILADKSERARRDGDPIWSRNFLKLRVKIVKRSTPKLLCCISEKKEKKILLRRVFRSWTIVQSLVIID